MAVMDDRNTQTSETHTLNSKDMQNQDLYTAVFKGKISDIICFKKRTFLN